MVAIAAVYALLVIGAEAYVVRTFAPITSVPDVPSSPERDAPDAMGALADRVFAPLDASPSAQAPSAPVMTAAPLTPARVERGASVYVRAGCVLCHGSRGEGVVGPALARTQLPIDAVARQVRMPIHPRMPAFAPEQLSDADIAAVYAFLMSLERP